MKSMTRILCFALIFGATGFADSNNFSNGSNFWEHTIQNLTVINITDLKDKELNEIMRGEHPLVAIEFSKETVLPIGFFLKGDLINLTENQVNCGQIEILQTFYVRCVENNLILSANLTEWKPLMEFITGTASIALNIQNESPCILFGAEVNRRS